MFGFVLIAMALAHFAGKGEGATSSSASVPGKAGVRIKKTEETEVYWPAQPTAGQAPDLDKLYRTLVSGGMSPADAMKLTLQMEKTS